MRRSLSLRPFDAPARAASIARNLLAEPDRAARWRATRDALWALLEPLVPVGGSVVVVGAGNTDDVPLTARGARRREPRALRSAVTVIEHDVTAGAADAIARAAARGRVPDRPLVPGAPLPGAPYDLVIGDLFYSQLLYPPLVDLDVPAARRHAFLERYGDRLTRAVVARLHASAPYRPVVHLHDPLAWWPGHRQSVSLHAILALAQRDLAGALRLAATGEGPRECDPRCALAQLRIPVRHTALWRWPFAPDADYLVCATVAGSPPAPALRS